MNTSIPAIEFDVIVIGGSYAGLSAALQLARARRRVLVVDAGQRRNRFAVHSHGFLSNDGAEASAIVERSRAQLQAYPHVAMARDTVTQAWADGDRCGVRFADGGEVSSRRLILAGGVVDGLPDIDGLAERWGRSVFHCPYCHGYELDEGAIGVIATGPVAMHHALLLPDWGRVTLFLNDAFVPDAMQRAALAARGVTVEAAPVARIEEEATVVLKDGRRHAMAGLFLAPRTSVSGSLAQQLGCAMEAGPLGEFVQTDALKATTAPGVFCCGDMARAAGNVA
ncbi:MAG: NAD(P)/FAD-dependent oxidoreductase, partial [Massilia sp.]